ncbi:hypothetical protein B0H16DRAFT_1470548 [Mycena metata]|uniref:Uncharacterized protein n=1 Tax=Mycena metata TaxID=1033252 RepID=A0AAD7HU29_9AGAR|nr:hypothetical protein B0H16DRAFT_1470548 [Mycena metata]
MQINAVLMQLLVGNVNAKLDAVQCTVVQRSKLLVEDENWRKTKTYQVTKSKEMGVLKTPALEKIQVRPRPRPLRRPRACGAPSPGVLVRVGRARRRRVPARSSTCDAIPDTDLDLDIDMDADADVDNGEDDARAIAAALGDAGVDALGRVVSSSSSASAFLKPVDAHHSKGREEEEQGREQEGREQEEGKEEGGEPTESQLSRLTHILQRSALYSSFLERQMREARERHAFSFAQDDGGKGRGRKGAKRRRVEEDEEDGEGSTTRTLWRELIQNSAGGVTAADKHRRPPQCGRMDRHRPFTDDPEYACEIPMEMKLLVNIKTSAKPRDTVKLIVRRGLRSGSVQFRANSSFRTTNYARENTETAIRERSEAGTKTQYQLEIVQILLATNSI